MSVWRTARAMARRGKPVFPCKAGEKVPLVPRGFKAATTDPDGIDGWADRWPDANLAMPTGHRSGLLVIDLDRKHGRDGFATLARLEADLGPLPATLTAATPSGGEHRFFQMPTEAPIRCSAGRVCGAPAPGFDVRGDGGYVLVAPSVVGDRPYTFTPCKAPAVLPSAWVRVLSRPFAAQPRPVGPWAPTSDRDRDAGERWVLRALQNEARLVAQAPPGTRNDRLWASAAALGGLVHTKFIDAQDVRRALHWACSRWTKRSPRKDNGAIERGIAFGTPTPARAAHAAASPMTYEPSSASGRSPSGLLRCGRSQPSMVWMRPFSSLCSHRLRTRAESHHTKGITCHLRQ